MTTTVTKIIGTGGDYTTLQAWEDACPANLVTSDQVWQGKAKNQVFSSGSATLLTISGTTVDATRYVELTTDTGASFLDNASVRTNALRYNESNGAAIKTTAAYITPIIVDQNYTRINKLQIANTFDGTGARPAINIGNGGGATNCDVNQCVLESYSRIVATSSAGTFAAYGSGNTLRNSLVVQRWNNSGAYIAAFSSGSSVYNCTLVSTNAVSTALYGLYGTCTVKNCYVGGAGTISGGSTTFSKTTSYTDLSGPPSGWTGVVALSTSTFENVTDGTHDFRLKSGSGLIDVGTTDSTNAATDISATARPAGASYDVGAWEYAAGGTDATAGGATLTGTSDLTAGSATATGTASGATLTGTSDLTAGSASGSCSFTTPEALANNAGSLWLSQAVYWTWTPSGRIGSMAGTTPIDGTATTHATTGLFTALGLPAGAGCLQVAVRGATPADDAVYHVAGTAA